MKRLALVALSVSLSGCVANDIYVKQGVTMDRYERDGVGCATEATQAVPTNTQVGWAPYVGIYSADTNLPLREKNMEICMRDRGYQKVSLPYCSGAALKAATAEAKLPRSSTKTMRVGTGSCYIMDAKGQAYLYTP